MTGARTFAAVSIGFPKGGIFEIFWFFSPFPFSPFPLFPQGFSGAEDFISPPGVTWLLANLVRPGALLLSAGEAR
jgi:hypothetical protein